MKKAIAIGCLLLITAVPVAAWATTCCPPEHDMGMRPAEDCLVPATQAASASTALKSFTEESQRHLVSGALGHAEQRDSAAPCRRTDIPRTGGPSPGLSHSSSVLLR